MVIETQTKPVTLTAAEERLMHISSELLDLSVMLERAKVVVNSVLDYFGDRKEDHEKNQGMYLLHYYDNARVFSWIANEYVYNALQLTEKLMEDIELNIEGDKKNEDR